MAYSLFWTSLNLSSREDLHRWGFSQGVDTFWLQHLAMLCLSLMLRLTGKCTHYRCKQGHWITTNLKLKYNSSDFYHIILSYLFIFRIIRISRDILGRYIVYAGIQMEIIWHLWVKNLSKFGHLPLVIAFMNLIPVETCFILVFFTQVTPTSWLSEDTRYVCTYQSYEFTTIFFRFFRELVFT